jgi:excisionase family DNA binding protein
MAVRERVPVFAPDGEEPSVRELDAYLAQTKGVAKLVAPSGEHLELPHSVYRVLERVVHEMKQGKSIAVMPLHEELSTQEAAELLNVSRPFLVSLLEEKKIPFKKVGSHRRVRLDDLLVYKENRDNERLQALDEMAREAQEEGFYDE